MKYNHPLPELANDFRNVTYLVLQALGHKADRMTYDVAAWLDDKEHPKKQVRAMRGMGKSITTSGLCVSEIYKNPNISIIVVSGVANLAQDFIGIARKVIDAVPVFNHLAPGEDDKDGAVQFVSRARTIPQKDPTVWACGISTAKTGHHADLIICDDIETPENSDTIEKREKLLKQIEELEDLLNVNGRIVFLNTPQSYDSVYIELERRGYIPRRWPSRYTNPDDEEESKWVSPMLLDEVRSGRKRVGEPTYPERFTEEKLLEREAKYGPARYALQMQCDPRLADKAKFPLKLKDFIVMETHRDIAPLNVVWGTSEPVQDLSSVGFSGDKWYHPIMVDRTNYAPYELGVMFIDPSGGGTVQGDEVGYAIAKVRNGIIYVLEVGGLAGGHSSQNMITLSQRAADNNIKRVVIESNYGKGMFTKLLAPVMGDINGPTEIVDQESGNTQKEKRIIDTLMPLLGSHRLVVDLKVAADYTLSKQITHITYNRGALKHDDRIEALAGAVAAVSQALPSVSYEKRSAENAKAEQLKAFERWKTECTLGLSNATGFFVTSKGVEPLVPRRTNERKSAVLDRWKKTRTRMRR